MYILESHLAQLGLILGFVFLLLAGLIPWRQPRPGASLSRWPCHVMAPLETPDGFYSRLYAHLKARFEERQLPISEVGFGPTQLLSRRNVFSPRPVYLAIKYQDLTYYVYAAPAPDGLFISSWLFSKYTAWESHPLLRWLLLWRQAQQTIFQMDMLDLFHGTAHAALLDVVDSYREEQGLAPLEEYEKRPVLHSFYAAMKQGTAPAGYAMPNSALASNAPPSHASSHPAQADAQFDRPTGGSIGGNSTSQSPPSQSPPSQSMTLDTQAFTQPRLPLTKPLNRLGEGSGISSAPANLAESDLTEPIANQDANQQDTNQQITNQAASADEIAMSSLVVEDFTGDDLAGNGIPSDGIASEGIALDSMMDLNEPGSLGPLPFPKAPRD